MGTTSLALPMLWPRVLQAWGRKSVLTSAALIIFQKEKERWLRDDVCELAGPMQDFEG